METAKVDIRKLQLLNDRINQTMEALNQVRLSVFGISHTGQLGPGQMFGQVPGMGFGGFGGGVQQQNPYFSALQGGGLQGQVPGMVPGFSHTSGINPMAYGLFPQLLGGGQWGQQQFGGMGQFGSPWQQSGIQGGLGHTSGESVDPSWFARGMDPNVGRIGQTFPFVQWGYSPFGQGYSQYGSAAF